MLQFRNCLGTIYYIASEKIASGVQAMQIQAWKMTAKKKITVLNM